MIDSGEVKSLDDLAARHGVDRSYVGRILRLAALAPDIMRAFVAGKEPDGLSLAGLTKDIPLQWDEQRLSLAAHVKN